MGRESLIYDRIVLGDIEASDFCALRALAVSFEVIETNRASKMKARSFENKKIFYQLSAIILTFSLILVPSTWMSFFLTAALLPLLAWASILVFTSHHRRRQDRERIRRKEQGLCTGCGYDLRATTDLCPECGTPVTYGVVLCNDNIHRFEDFINVILTAVPLTADKAVACTNELRSSSASLLVEARHEQAVACCLKLNSLDFAAKLRGPGGRSQQFNPDYLNDPEPRPCRNCGHDLRASKDRCPICREPMIYWLLLFRDKVHTIAETADAVMQTTTTDTASATCLASQVHYAGFAPIAGAHYDDAIIYGKKLRFLGFCAMLHAPNRRHELFVPQSLKESKFTEVPEGIDPAKLIWCAESNTWLRPPTVDSANGPKRPDSVVALKNQLYSASPIE